MNVLGKFPNFPTVDFYELGDALEVVDSLNLSSLQTGITEIDKTNSVTAFPNPSKGLFQLNWKSQMKATVSLFNSTGKLVEELEARETSLQINLDGLPEGVYHAVIQTENAAQTVKLVHLH